MRYLQSRHLGGSLPHAFTEHGVLMLANVLKSEQAIMMSIFRCGYNPTNKIKNPGRQMYFVRQKCSELSLVFSFSDEKNKGYFAAG